MGEICWSGTELLQAIYLPKGLVVNVLISSMGEKTCMVEDGIGREFIVLKSDLHYLSYKEYDRVS